MAQNTSQAAKTNPSRRVLFFSKNPKALSASIQYLRLHGYSVAVLEHMADVGGAIQAVQPEVVLLSWGFGVEEVRRTYQNLNKDLPAILAVVFSESELPRDTMSLTRSGIPTTIFPPLSGKGIQSRIEMFLAKRDGTCRNSKRTVRKSDLDERDQVLLRRVRAVKPEDLPNDTEISWAEVRVDSSESGATGTSVRVWRSSPVPSSSPGSKPAYILEASEQPRFNRQLGKWEGLTGKILAADMTDLKEEDLNSAFLHLALDVEDLDATPLVPPNGDEDTSNTFRNYRRPGVAEPTYLEKVVRSLANELFAPQAGDSAKVTQLQTIGVLPVIATEFKGYMLLGISDNAFHPEWLEPFAKKFATIRIEKTPSTPCEVFEVEIAPCSFRDFRDHIDFAATFSHKGQDIVAVLIPMSDLPENFDAEKQFLSVDPMGTFVASTQISFDVYLPMPASSKNILYLKKGTVIPDAAIQKMQKLGSRRVVIPASELESFISYQIQTTLRQD